MANAGTSIRGTLNFSIRDTSSLNIGKRFKREPFIVVERFRGHVINSTKFAKREHAEHFIASELKRLR